MHLFYIENEHIEKLSTSESAINRNQPDILLLVLLVELNAFSILLKTYKTIRKKQ